MSNQALQPPSHARNAPSAEYSRRVDWCVANGLSAVPLVPGSKKPILKNWNILDNQLLSVERLRVLLTQGYNLAVVCNTAFSCLDFEKLEDYHVFFTNHNELERITLVQSTPHGGIHVCFRNVTQLPRQLRIAGKEHPIDLLGSSSYAVLAPSIINHAKCDRTSCNKNGYGQYTILASENLILFNETISTISDRIRELGWTVNVPITVSHSPQSCITEKRRFLPQSRKLQIVQAVVPHWKRGTRNQLNMYLIAYMLKEHVVAEDAKDVVAEICQATGDEESENRLQNVEYHYNNRAAILPRLKGYSGLREALGGKSDDA